MTQRPAPPRRLSIRPRIALKHALLGVATLALAACGGNNEESARGGWGGGGGGAPAQVIPAYVTYQTDIRVIEAVGTARARATALIQPETGGEVAAVSFSAGDVVEEGAPLLSLDAEQERLAYQLAQVSVEEAEQLLARYRRIENTGAVSDSAIDEARTALDAARIDRERAKLAYDRRTVRAPFAGVIGLTDVDPGARVTQQTVIAQLDDRSTLFVDFPVPEEVFGRLNPGDSVQVQSFSEELPRIAEIATLDSRIDTTTRSFTARAKIDNSDDRLRPGMSFRVAFSLEGRRYPAVPEASILWGSDGAYVWAVVDGAAEQTPINIISRDDGMVLVDAPLAEGAVIVAEGVQKVREGGAVTLRPAPAPAAPAGQPVGADSGTGMSVGSE